MYLDNATYGSVASRLQPFFFYEIKTEKGQIVEYGQMGATTSRSGNAVTIAPVPGTVWQSSSSHRTAAGSGYRFRFIGQALYSGEQREREKIQTCIGVFGVNERTNSVATRFRSTFGSGDARFGRLGNAERLTNLTLCEHLVLSGSGESNHTHVGFRAKTGYIYDVNITIGGTWGFGSQTGVATYGVDFGIQYSFKSTTTTTWGSWLNATLTDATSGTLTYDASNAAKYNWNTENGIDTLAFEGVDKDTESGDSRFACLLKAKYVAGGTGFKDTALPQSINFAVGGNTGAFYNTADMDIRFRPVYAATESNRQVEKVYIADATLKAIRNG